MDVITQKELIEALGEVISLVDFITDEYDVNLCKCITGEYTCRYHTAKSVYDKSTKYDKYYNRAIGVRCITTDKTFKSQSEAGRYYGIQPASIGKCCRGLILSAGKHDGIKLKWEFMDL